MTRVTPRPVAPKERDEETPPRPPSLGWRIALAVWVTGFVGLLLYELLTLLWKLARGVF